MRISVPFLAVLSAAIAAVLLTSDCGEDGDDEVAPSATLASGIVTPTPGAELDVCPLWLPGDHRTLDLFKARERSGAGDDDLSQESTEEVRIEVTSADEEETLFTWTFDPGTARQDGISYEDAKALAAAFDPQTQEPLESVEVAAGIPVQIVADACGAYLEIGNLEEVHRAYREAIESLFDLIRNAEGIDDSQRAMLDNLSTSYVTPQLVEGILFKYVGPFFDVYGGLYEYGRAEEFPDYGMNPFGGDPFPATVTYQLESLDSGCGLIRKSVTFDPDETRRIMIQTFEQLAAEAGSEPIPTDDVPSFVVNDQMETVFCEDDAWVKSVKWTRESTLGDVSQIDIVEMVARD